MYVIGVIGGRLQKRRHRQKDESRPEPDIWKDSTEWPPVRAKKRVRTNNNAKSVPCSRLPIG